MKKLRLLMLSVALLLSAVFIGATAATTAFAAENEEHEHWWHITEYVEPTCTEQGYTLHVCFYCEDSHKDNFISALGHTYQSVTIAPTCTARGYTTHFCTVCGFEYVDNYIDALGHVFESEVIAPTCTTDGYTLFTCTTDGYSYKDNYIYAYGHTYIPDVLAATCTEGGYTTYTCSDCGDSYVADYTQPKGHNHKEYVTLPTCVAYGYTEHICEDCGDKYVTDYVRPHGHDYVKTVIKPTDSKAGYTINTCRDCDYSYLSDFVTSGDVDFEEHIHEHSLFVARYDSQEYFVLQNYCECGEIDNSLVNLLFIDESGNYIPLSINANGEVHYSHLYGDYNVYILNKQGEMLSAFKVRAGEIPEVHTHDYSLTVTRNNDEKNFVFEYKCDCDEVGNSLINVIFIDKDSNYITIGADNSGKVDYSALSSGNYNVFILNNKGEMLSTFKVTIPEEVIPEEHFHDFVLSVTRCDDEKRFIVQYVCKCGEIQTAVFRATFIDDSGNSTTLTADEYGNIDYSQLVGKFNVFILSNQGEMLSNFRLEVVAEHIHDYTLSITRNDDEKYFIVENLCECGETESIVFHVVVIDKGGNSVTMNADNSGKIDYSQLAYGKYNVVILSNQGERLSNFELLIVEKEIHTHDFSLSIVRNDNEKYFTVKYLCDCGEIETAVFNVTFMDESGNCTTLSANGFGKVDYSQLAYGSYNVFILNAQGEMLSNFRMTLIKEHIHDYSLSLTRNDNEKYFTVNYLCECGEIENAVFYAVFSGGSNYTTLTADNSGKVNYSQLAYGKYNVVILSSKGTMLTNFELTIAEEEIHSHNFTLSVVRNDNEKFFTVRYLCECGEIETAVFNVTFMDESGNCTTLSANAIGKVDYSQLVGNYNVIILNAQGEMLSNFRLEVLADHTHNYSLSVVRNDEEMYFTLQDLCECGDTQNSIFHVICIDEGGNYITLNQNQNGKVDYSSLLCGKYNVVILSNQGEMLSAFELFIAEEEVHNHDYSLSVVKNDSGKYLTINYLCKCGAVENAVFNVTFIDENGNGTTITADANGKVDYSKIPYGIYNVFILDGQGEMLSTFKLSFIKEHIHDFSLSVIRNDNEKYFIAQYLCECGEIENAVFHAIFTDESGNYVTLSTNENGKINYTGLVGNYNVLILNNQGKVLSSFTLFVAEEVIHVHDYSLSVARNDNEKSFVVQYLCECGETQSVIFRAIFIDENGNYVTLNPNEYGKVSYSQLVGNYNVFIINNQGGILSNFKVTAEVSEIHTHNYSLSVTKNDEEMYFTLQYACGCGETKNATFHVILLNENGDNIILFANEDGEVYYSHLEDGDFTVYISDSEGNVLSTFELSVYEEEIPNEPDPSDDTDEDKGTSALTVVTLIMLILIAAGGIAFFFYKKRNKKSN